MTRIRKVTFNQKANEFFIPFKKFTPSEAKLVWYSRRELKRMRLDLKVSLREFSISPPSSDDETEDEEGGANTDREVFHWRGLEHIKRGTSLENAKDRHYLVRGVLSLQELHKTLGLDHNDKGVPFFTRAFTKEARLRAREIAIQDFNEALKIYNERTLEELPSFTTDGRTIQVPACIEVEER